VHKNFKRQRRLENRLGETVRVASIVQKGMRTGRSSYVEMRALDRLTNYNVKLKVRAIKSQKVSSDLDDLLSKIPAAISDGYSAVLTPNGIVRENDLDRLLSIDSDIVTCLGIIESELRANKKVGDVVATLKELAEERKKLVGSLRAGGASLGPCIGS
jgi:hypothetical protein